MTVQKIRQWTDRDPLLSKVRECIRNGWESAEDTEGIRPYLHRKTELSVEDGCILWGRRVVIPPAGRESVLQGLHTAHPGIARMKSLARSYVWWPGLDADLEAKVKSCISCQENQKSPPQAPLHPWEWPEHPWSRVHVDYAGPFMGKMFLILVDAHSKWMEVCPVSAATSQVTIEKLRMIFATHGLPQILVSDNGTCFTSTDFEDFLRMNGIRHVTSSPYHPASNGLAERAVQSFKAAMKKAGKGSMETNLARFLFRYRITPHTTTGRSPAELLMGRRLHSHLDQLLPGRTTADTVRRKQEAQKSGHDSRAKQRNFSVGDTVFVKDFARTPITWVSGTVLEQAGPLSYRVELADGRVVRRHVDHVRSRSSTVSTTEDMNDDWNIPAANTSESPDNPREPANCGRQPHRSARLRQPPDRYGIPVTF